MTVEEMDRMEMKVAANPGDYNLHLQYIALVEAHGILKQLRSARRGMAKAFPLPAGVWAPWIAEEVARTLNREKQADAAGADMAVDGDGEGDGDGDGKAEEMEAALSVDEVCEWFELALADFYSPEMWAKYAQFMQQYHQHILFATDAATTAGSEQYKAWCAVRGVFDRMLAACALDPTAVAMCFTAYRDLETAWLDAWLDLDEPPKDLPCTVRPHCWLVKPLAMDMDFASTAKDVGYDDTATHLLPHLGALASDMEMAVRQALAEALPSIAKWLDSDGGEAGHNDVVTVVWPHTVQLVYDMHPTVREAAVAAVSDVAAILTSDEKEQHVIKLLLDLRNSDDAELRMASVHLMNLLAECCGAALVKESIVPEYTKLSEDQMFRVRKQVALNFEHILQVVGPTYAAQHLLPVYKRLCGDEIWGVRKACAESIVDISKGMSAEVRQAEVLSVFESFAADVSRWVRNCAFQHLGPLIATLEGSQVTTKLVEQFTMMADSSSHKWEDSDISLHCAYNFPAVAVTIGKERWGEISAAYHTLVKDVQWKVRRTLSYSLHEVAKIVGTSIAEATLLSVFEFFLKDLDEVKTGVLTHVADFLEVLSPPVREKYIQTLKDLQVESENWRFRQLLASQMHHIGTLYEDEHLSNAVVPLAMSLCKDPVASVRTVANRELGKVLQRLAKVEDKTHLDALCKEVLLLGEDQSYQGRQMFAFIALNIIEHADAKLVEEVMLEPLLLLADDPVANVRIMLAKVFHAHSAHPALKGAKANEVRAKLKEDKDADVRFLVG